MAHHCINWTTTPPVRKTPLLVLTRGDEHIYTTVPKDLKTLEEIARKEFDLGDVVVRFSSSCVNLCHGQPARITESAWEHISLLIGCATVETMDNRARGGVQFPAPLIQDHRERESFTSSNERHTKQKLLQLDEQTPSDKDPSDNGASAFSEHEQGVSTSVRRSKRRRRAVSKEKDSDGFHSPLAGFHAIDTSQGKPIKRESDIDSQPQPQFPHMEVGYATQTQTQTRVSGENDKVLICVAHPPSKQAAKFTAKSTTRVFKVLATVCRSFGLDVNLAALFLVVSVEDEDGPVENLFRCENNETISRSGAERDAEARFVVKLEGDV